MPQCSKSGDSGLGNGGKLRHRRGPPALGTANARVQLVRTCGMVEIALAQVTETRPATRSRMLGAVPL